MRNDNLKKLLYIKSNATTFCSNVSYQKNHFNLKVKHSLSHSSKCMCV